MGFGVQAETEVFGDIDHMHQGYRTVMIYNGAVFHGRMHAIIAPRD